MDDDPEMEIVQGGDPGDPGLKDVVEAVPTEENTDVSTNVRTADDLSDSELDELLDESLGEFGKHLLPSDKKPAEVKPCSSATSNVSAEDLLRTASCGASQDTSELDEIFSSEFVAEAESQLGDAMKALSDENPELWQQFESFTKSVGLQDMGMGPIPPSSGAATKGESSVDSNLGATGGATLGATGGEGTNESCGKSEGDGDRKDVLDEKLDQTIKRLQDNTAQLGADPGNMEELGGLSDMMSRLDVGSDDGEEQFLKMMEGMMSTLLSKEILYPSLVNLCQQYPDWLSSHHGKISEEDYQRCSMQLEIMTAICKEFENPPESGPPPSGDSDSILQLMQELQKYGQPPDDLGGVENMQRGSFPAGLQNFLSDPQNCTIM